jgi:hypothetical protein
MAGGARVVVEHARNSWKRFAVTLDQVEPLPQRIDEFGVVGPIAGTGLSPRSVERLQNTSRTLGISASPWRSGRMR